MQLYGSKPNNIGSHIASKSTDHCFENTVALCICSCERERPMLLISYK